jgi:radical SAM superfamily enzyme YgiQ (UPF0313 family)
MSKKVVFCFHTNDHEYNMGIGFLSSFLKKNGVETDLAVYREIPGRSMDTPESVTSEILGKGPTVVAFSVMTFNWLRIRKVISLLRQMNYKGLIVVGGYHAILAPDEVLSEPGVDAVCIGEGEEPLLELTRLFHDGSRGVLPPMRGILFKGDDPYDISDKRWLVENLEDYPYVDYDIFDAEGGEGLSKKLIGSLSPAGIFSLAVITGRGCPYKCTYCSNSALINHYGGVKKFLRRYSVETAVKNIKGLCQKFGPQFIEFLDETFTLNKKWVEDFCALYKKEIGLPFSLMSRIDIMDDHTVSVLAEAGAKLVFFGLESGDEDYRSRYLNRKMSNATIIEGARTLRKHGIMIVTFNMFGMPYETVGTISKTFDLNAAIEPDVAIPFIYQVFPSTELARKAYEGNMVPSPPEGRWDYCTPSLDTLDLPASDVAGIVQDFRERFGNKDKVERVYKTLRQLASP